MDDAGRNTVTQSLFSLAISLAVMAILLFVPAGTLNWAHGWWFMAVFVAITVVAVLYLARVNPEIFAARKGIARGTKTWDYVILVFVMGGFFAVLPVAALDDARFRWAPAPEWLVLTGYAIFGVGYAVQVWSQAVNRHFEPSVRIQNDRGHTVIDTGPYAIVRHPGYISGSFLVVGCALALGSLWALVPAAIVIAALIVRTLLEERTLRAELPGYSSYTERVRYRWVPGVW